MSIIEKAMGRRGDSQSGERLSPNVIRKVIRHPASAPAATNPANRTTGPNRLRFATMVLFAGFVVAGALAFLLHDIRPTFLTAKSLRDVTGLPVLGTVSMKWQPRQLFRLRVEFASFVIVASLLVATYGGVILFEDAGVRLTQSLIRMI